jgi:hypothetical protein
MLGIITAAQSIDSTRLSERIATFAPLGAPYIQVPGSSLGPGASASVVLQFANPTNAPMIYSTRTLNSIPTP